MQAYNLTTVRAALTAEANYNENNAVYLFFHAFSWGAWVDAEEVAACGDAYDWAEDVLTVALDEFEAIAAVAELRNHDYEIKDAEGLVNAFCCFSHWGACNWEAFGEALECGLDAEVIEAGLALGIELENIGDTYVGTGESDEAFIMEHHAEIDSELPAHLRAYFDWEAYTRDMMIDTYHAHYGHYFFQR